MNNDEWDNADRVHQDRMDMMTDKEAELRHRRLDWRGFMSIAHCVPLEDSIFIQVDEEVCIPFFPSHLSDLELQLFKLDITEEYLAGVRFNTIPLAEVLLKEGRYEK